MGNLVQVAKVIWEVVAEFPDSGVPAGHVYAALMTAGIELGQFEIAVASLVSANLLRREGHVLFALPIPNEVSA